MEQHKSKVPMEEEGGRERGAIAAYLVEDHRRLDGLLERAVADPDRVDRESYDRFRAGLLRHIGMEEKILLPAIQRWRGGSPWPMAPKLRLDHGAIASLLMPTPTASVIGTLRDILAEHNGVEEGPEGLYATGDELAGAETDQMLARLRAAPDVAVMPHSDTEAVINTVRRAVEKAGYRLKK
ncbi:MAG: hemerythrin domain-containing protein [Nitrospira sp.]|nr:hemerythrin domain-containing protein [Nitrospira sp.]MCP9475467.1 hemerythrin domain-containing protein [Nitrospira sp.]